MDCISFNQTYWGEHEYWLRVVQRSQARHEIEISLGKTGGLHHVLT